METIRGKTSCHIDFYEFTARLTGYSRVALDLGTGDGRFVASLARQHPDWFVIGLDACRENLHEHSRTQLPNALFAIAAAEHMPPDLSGLISHLTINFPWGSLLAGLLHSECAVMEGVSAVARPLASLELRLNAGALAEAGYALEDGGARVQESLSRYGWQVTVPACVERSALGAFPSTWARRVAHGRDPKALRITGRFSP